MVIKRIKNEKEKEGNKRKSFGGTDERNGVCLCDSSSGSHGNW